MAVSLWDFGAFQALVHTGTGEYRFIYGDRAEGFGSDQEPWTIGGNGLGGKWG